MYVVDTFETYLKIARMLNYFYPTVSDFQALAD